MTARTQGDLQVDKASEMSHAFGCDHGLLCHSVHIKTCWIVYPSTTSLISVKEFKVPALTVNGFG